MNTDGPESRRARSAELRLVSRRRPPPRRLPARVVHPQLWMSLVSEDELVVNSATLLDHGPRDPVQHDVPIDPIFHVSPRDDEDGSLELRNPNLPTPSQAADLVLPRARVNLEERHPGEVRRKLREPEALLLHRERIRRPLVRMA